MDAQALLQKADPQLVTDQLAQTVAGLEKLTAWTHQSVEKVIRSLQEEHQWHKGQYFMMLRLAVTGKKATPPLFETITVLGQQETTVRLKRASAALG